MTKRDLFRVIIKLFGLYSLVISLFSIIPGSFSYLLQAFDLPMLIGFLSIMALVCLLFVALIRKTDKIIDWLKLDKGFDDDTVNIGNLSAEKIIMLGTIIVGGFMLIDNFATFVNYTYLGFKEFVGTTNTHTSQGDYSWLISFLNLIIGYLLITNYTWIAKKLVKKAEAE